MNTSNTPFNITHNETNSSFTSLLSISSSAIKYLNDTEDSSGLSADTKDVLRGIAAFGIIFGAMCLVCLCICETKGLRKGCCAACIKSLKYNEININNPPLSIDTVLSEKIMPSKRQDSNEIELSQLQNDKIRRKRRRKRRIKTHKINNNYDVFSNTGRLVSEQIQVKTSLAEEHNRTFSTEEEQDETSDEEDETEV